jgi:hypothetical protein
VTFAEGEFERSEVPGGAFRLVFSAQAWHWIEPEVRYVRARHALAAGGALAAFWNQAAWPRSELREAMLGAYERSGAELIAHGPMYPGEPTPLDMGTEWAEQITAAAGFAVAPARRYRWSCDYTADAYVELLATHSDHIVLDAEIRDRLFREVRAVIEQAGGSFALPYSTLLCLARAE